MVALLPILVEQVVLSSTTGARIQSALFPEVHYLDTLRSLRFLIWISISPYSFPVDIAGLFFALALPGSLHPLHCHGNTFRCVEGEVSICIVYDWFHKHSRFARACLTISWYDHSLSASLTLVLSASYSDKYFNVGPSWKPKKL